MIIKDIEKKQNDIEDLPLLPVNRYENIFNMGTNNSYYFFNINKTIKFPDNLDKNIFYEKIVNARKPYTAISFDSYGTQDLWWLILLANKITNPVSVVKPGTKLKIIKQKYIKDIIKSIQTLSNA